MHIDLQPRMESPLSFTPARLDDYLAHGWRPMGQRIYTAHFALLGDGRLHSTICTRLPLQDYRFSKSLRKLRRRNGRQFQIRRGTARLTARKREINQRYGDQFPDRYYPDLEFHLEGPGQRMVFDTREIEVYEGARLAAFSFFDAGHKSLYSKIGIYDPRYRRHSPGLYTMLLEIEWALEQGMHYYYPGYVVPGFPEFDYKHRVGELEYLDIRSGAWRPFPELTPADIPLRTMERHLRELAARLRARGVACDFYYNLFFDLGLLYDMAAVEYLAYPVFLVFGGRSGRKLNDIAVFNFITQKFEWLEARFVPGFFPVRQPKVSALDKIVMVAGRRGAVETVEDFLAFV